MLDSTVDDEAVAGVDVEGISCHIDVDDATNYIYKLVMGMAMASTDPTLLKIMTHEHQLVGVGKDLPLHPGFWGKCFC
jgi:hypothetical protein